MKSVDVVLVKKKLDEYSSFCYDLKNLKTPYLRKQRMWFAKEPRKKVFGCAFSNSNKYESGWIYFSIKLDDETFREVIKVLEIAKEKKFQELLELGVKMEIER